MEPSQVSTAAPWPQHAGSDRPGACWALAAPPSQRCSWHVEETQDKDAEGSGAPHPHSRYRRRNYEPSAQSTHPLITLRAAEQKCIHEAIKQQNI